MKIARDLVFPSPAPHHSVWTLNVAYAEPTGERLLLSRVDNNSYGLGSARWQEWTNEIQRYASDDNGVTWQFLGEAVANGNFHQGYGTRAWHHQLDPATDRLVSLCQQTTLSDDGTPLATLWSQWSTDGGRVWTELKQVICPGCDARCWAPGLDAAHDRVGVDQGPFEFLDDGTLVFGFTLRREGLTYGVRFLSGSWTAERDDFTWSLGEELRVPTTISASGVCEPDLLPLGGRRLVTTMRCQGIPKLDVPSTRQVAVSEDGGLTWSEPTTLCYDDGSPVYVPASLAGFEVEPVSGRALWIANILDHPVYAQTPRYPLCLAEFDRERLCLKRDTVAVIQDLPEGAVEANVETNELGRRYSNFGHYVDRVTGELVLMMAEEPRTDWDDASADLFRWRIKL